MKHRSLIKSLFVKSAIISICKSCLLLVSKVPLSVQLMLLLFFHLPCSTKSSFFSLTPLTFDFMPICTWEFAVSTCLPLSRFQSFHWFVRDLFGLFRIPLSVSFMDISFPPLVSLRLRSSLLICCFSSRGCFISLSSSLSPSRGISCLALLFSYRFRLNTSALGDVWPASGWLCRGLRATI